MSEIYSEYEKSMKCFDCVYYDACDARIQAELAGAHIDDCDGYSTKLYFARRNKGDTEQK